MRHLSLLLVGALSACASHNAPPAASSDSVQAATDTPTIGPNFAPVSTDGEAAAAVDPHDAARAAGTAQNTPAPPSTPATTGASDNSGNVPAATGNVAAMPAQSPRSSPYEADNSRVNARDRSGSTLTPMDQGSSEADRKLTQRIRQAVVSDSSLSFTAKNVKIITLNGKVTLRGAVKTDEERIRVSATAKQIAGDAQVESFLEVSK
jgi:hyperosmotically inducible protein